MHLFYLPELDPEMQSVTLPEEESKHCVKVLRLQPGDAIKLTDGRGYFYDAELTLLLSKKSQVKIVNCTFVPSPRKNRLHLAVAPTKNSSRFEWFLEKATEIGVDEITPLITAHSERKVVKVERLNRILIAAMKQSLKARLPQLNEPVDISEFIEKSTENQKFIAYCGEAEKRSLFTALADNGPLVIAIGPEGDFSPEEVEQAMGKGFSVVTLGESRLRTESAGVVACHTAVLWDSMLER